MLTRNSLFAHHPAKEGHQLPASATTQAAAGTVVGEHLAAAICQADVLLLTKLKEGHIAFPTRRLAPWS
ncbi:hypothetical protein [Streptomyces sp. MBT84]|uniref:hypothetical protein n=1 Tax=Streptomyces sp. MBT84 TaxID=1488414 RepID=UPI001C6E1FBB|nr:hypothetical protein [Streptomyces sp. MBT84]